MKIKTIIYCALLFSITSCDKESESPDFDRGAMLVDLNTQVIQNAYSSNQAAFEQLDLDANQFYAEPTNLSLANLRESFRSAYLQFQHLKMFNFGYFESYEIRKAINTYPTDTAKIQSNINTGAYHLELAENVQAIGLPALDYLLFGRNDSDVLLSFTTDTDASNRLSYLTAVTLKMKNEIKAAAEAWSTESQDFVQTTGNDATGSTNILFNAFVQDIELLKNAKIGIPAGNQTGGSTLPNYAEAFFSDLSIELAIENVKALKNCFLGNNSIGFDDYIRDVESADVQISLADQIASKFDDCEQALISVGAPLSERVNSDNASVQVAYTEIKSLVTYVKTDMASALGLLITFSDNDGD